MIEVTSGNVLAMEDSAFSNVLAELNEKHRQLRMAVLLPVIALALITLLLAAIGSASAVAVLVVPLA